MSETTTPPRWYREPQVWLLVSIPLAAVVGCAITVWLAIRSDDGVVRDDYYRQGLAINQALARDEAAAALRLQASIDYDPATATVRVSLTGPDPGAVPDSIELRLSHATRQAYDQRLQLSAAGKFQSAVQPLSPGRWYAEIGTRDWRLVRTLQVR
jgi:hypothetical protein